MDLYFGFYYRGNGDIFQCGFGTGKEGEFEVFVLICWSLWTERNLVVFQGKILDHQDVLARANRTKESYKIFVDLPERIRASPSSLCRGNHLLWDLLRSM